VSENFFEESKEQSQIKTSIVRKYFSAWWKVILGSEKRSHRELKVCYIDLFAGPGRYDDGTKSTPLEILGMAARDQDLGQALVAIFNDKDPNHSKSLSSEISAIPGIERLRFTPQVMTEEIDDEIVKIFDSMSLAPSLVFIDPWGYKGLSLKLIKSVLKDWGCDCIFFFNYNRINMGIDNDVVTDRMADLFGEERLAQLSKRMQGLEPHVRELVVIEELMAALQEMGGRYVLPFRFKNERGTRTSHHLFFVSKHPRGYIIMKDIMARESSTEEQGVPSFEYNLATEKQPLLFEYNRPLDDLKDILLAKFAGLTMSVKEIFERHNYGTGYIMRNYQQALKQLEREKKITISPCFDDRRKIKGEVTLADKCIVSFPPVKGQSNG
jgi:three-Cys-motif partner protein